uniref:Nbs3-OO n=1 Tax=Oryza officinalis TaxID=4535 RepID=E2CU77_9ORYZ|nr:Nbs3-OO [Oryza officinalis]
MAETVLSMARSVVGSAISKAASAAADETSLLLGVEKDIWYIKDELKTMQAFLRAAEVMKKKDELLKVWAEQIRDLSYDIEDSLDEFKVHIESQTLFRQLVKLRERHRIAIRIHNLKSRVEEVSSRNTRYSLVKPISSSTEDDMDSYAEDIRNQSARNVDEAELVGFSDSKKRLLEMIDVNANDGPAKVIGVVGMGGLGKTALSRKIFESEEDIRKNFPCNAWITVSQSFHRIELLKDMIRQLLGRSSLDQLLQELQGKVVVQVHHLSEYLIEELKEKRYFVVLDDLWFLHDWNWINDIAFPKSNKKGSRIVITTRDVGLAEKCTKASLVYHLDFLQMNDAITLLLRKTNKKHEDMESNKNMQNMVERIVNKCGRLPLAILTIGAVLATKHVSEWEKFYEQLPSELENNPSLEALRTMVTLGYNHLPSHLKSCFLYLSIFPEDFEIKRKRLVNRWIAEGFVRAKVGMTTKDVGESYFNELINRSMIQRSKVGIEGKVKSCRVHDIMRDITVSISRQENFVLLPMDDGSDLVQENTRHIAFHGSMSCKTGLDWSIVRSLAIFGDRPKSLAHAVCLDQLRMLRVMDLEDVEFLITQKDFNNIALLRHLKYLSIGSSSSIYSLPRSIGKLQGLQTLIMSRTYIATLPSEISKLQCLRSLRCIREFHYGNFSLNHPMKCITNTICLPSVFTPSVSHDDRAKQIAELHMATKSWWSESIGVKVPKGIGRLRDLQELECVDIRRTSSRAIKELGQLSKLRKLSVVTKGSTKEKCKILYKAIQKLCSLKSLYVDARGYSSIGTLECLDSISSPPPLLRTLWLSGSLEELPNWIEQLTHLMKFYLWKSKLKEGKTILILGALPNLMLLFLRSNAYLGEKLVFKTGAFPRLRIFSIYKLDQLREIRFEDGSSPLLEKIEIEHCRLESGIIGTIHLPRLKEISLEYESKVARLAQLEGELNAHPNRPVLRMEEDRRDHDLGAEAEGSSVEVEAMDPLPFWR